MRSTLEVRDESAARVARAEPAVQVEFPRCPYCHDDVLPGGEQARGCGGCLAWHHRACWEELARCGACGRFELTPGLIDRHRCSAAGLPALTLVGSLALLASSAGAVTLGRGFTSPGFTLACVSLLLLLTWRQWRLALATVERVRGPERTVLAGILTRSRRQHALWFAIQAGHQSLALVLVRGDVDAGAVCAYALTPVVSLGLMLALTRAVVASPGPLPRSGARAGGKSPARTAQ